MVNIEDFIKRLEIILDYYGLTASSFADKIGVQRSSMSHLLSGRNKPSLDFILKISEEFPEVTLEWILNGKGVFPKDDFVPATTPTPIEKKIESEINEDLFSTLHEEKTTAVEPQKNNLITDVSKIENHEIERIVIFFKNGTFKNYTS
jgi:transcriptional regulator with XRE-family HTH domain